MLYRETIAVCTEIHTKHINTVSGKKEELLNIKPVGTYSDHCVFRNYVLTVMCMYATTALTFWHRNLAFKFYTPCM
jgi:hypothetical protein